MLQPVMSILAVAPVRQYGQDRSAMENRDKRKATMEFSRILNGKLADHKSQK